MIRAVATVLDAIDTRKHPDQRFIVAIVGAPGAGKSTFADALCSALNQTDAAAAEVLPMDGFHLDNAVLKGRGLLATKGAPETFDADGFASILARIRRADKDVLVPVFDRDADIARAAARVIKARTGVIIAEGNYLLLDRAQWAQTREHYDLTVFLEVPMPVLEQRLIERWIRCGLDRDAAVVRARRNDLVNASVVITQSVPADICINSQEEPTQC